MKTAIRIALAASTFVFVAVPANAQQPMPDATAQFETRLQSVEDQMRDLNGKIEQNQFAVRKLESEMQRLQSDIDTRLSRIEASQQAAPQPPAPATTPAAAPATASNIVPPQTATTPTEQAAATQATSANGTLGAIKMQNGKITGGVDSPQAPPLPAVAPDYNLNPQEQYDRAFGLLRQANYDEAEKAFKAFIDKNPQDKLIDNAKYWYGETLYVRGKYGDAAKAFADAWQQNPRGPKAPDSLLKLAMSLENTDKAADACATLESIKSKYPTASLTVRSRADEEMQKLKCGGAH